MNDTLKLGIIGWPVAHSMSPAMHLAAGRAAGIDLEYELYEVPSNQLEARIKALCENGIRGFNVTVPHKVAILPLLSSISPQAQAIGAANVVVHEDGHLHGYNTDATGLVRSLQDAGVGLTRSRVVILGAGGAARAAAVGLANAGANSITIVARRLEQAETLCGALHSNVPSTLKAAQLSGQRDLFIDADLIVQATSATLIGNPHAQIFADSLHLSTANKNAVVVDLVYNPRLTTVLKAAHSNNIATVDGLGMLLHQGAEAFALWTLQSPSIEVMRAALLEQF